ncbi:MAG TPA: hypothetical protein VMU59_05105 [Caulobacteraceae bacterium]|nr:hypothetical protein [Caulobacteraceae bacterium]
MNELTYVSLVPKDSSGRLRQLLTEEDTGPLEWREVRTRGGSEFYFSGPPNLARRTHEYVTLWVANERWAKSGGDTADAPSGAPWRGMATRMVASLVGLLAFAIMAFRSSGATG